MSVPEKPAATSRLPDWVPYAAPFVLFLILTQIEGLGGPRLYPIFYTAKIIIIAALLAAGRRFYTEFKPDAHLIAPAIGIGVALCVLWVLVDGVTPHFAFLGKRAGYDPFAAISSVPLAWAFIAVRFAGLAAIVPVMEELFWRSFLLRFVIDPADFKRVPLGTFEITSFIAVVVLMAAAHPEWLAAALFSAAMNLWLYRTKNLPACIIAHAATNFALGVYVLLSRDWRYW